MRELIAVYDGIKLPIIPDQENEWLLETSLVAQGFRVQRNSIRMAQIRHSSELSEGKHYLLSQTVTAGQRRKIVFWTKRGIIRLGFFIKGEKAKRFRDWAEDLVLDKLTEAAQPIQHPEPSGEPDLNQISGIEMLAAFVNAFRQMEARIAELEIDARATRERVLGMEAKALQPPPPVQPPAVLAEPVTGEYKTVREYANMHRYRLHPALALEIGTQCGKVSRINGVPVLRINTGKNSYRIDILDNVFHCFGDRLSKYTYSNTLF